MSAHDERELSTWSDDELEHRRRDALHNYTNATMDRDDHLATHWDAAHLGILSEQMRRKRETTPADDGGRRGAGWEKYR